MMELQVPDQLARKRAALRRRLRELSPCFVAYSGGVDSTLLLHEAHETLGDDVVAVTIETPYTHQWELTEARAFIMERGITHHVVTLPVPDVVRDNPEERCYRCKKIIFSTLCELARGQGGVVVDGTNGDDSPEDRPGMAALAELGVASPLREAGFTKHEIRTLSQIVGLPTAHKPANSCLLTRLPHGTHVSEELLARIEQGEKLLRELGFSHVRLRVHGTLARIEVPREHMVELVAATHSPELLGHLEQLGFGPITMDLRGLHAPRGGTPPVQPEEA